MRNISSLTIGIAFIIGLFIVANAYKSRAKAMETITVTIKMAVHWDRNFLVIIFHKV
jgi:hypothetical protein